MRRPRGQEPFSMPRGILCLHVWKKVPDPFAPCVALDAQSSIVVDLDVAQLDRLTARPGLLSMGGRGRRAEQQGRRAQDGEEKGSQGRVMVGAGTRATIIIVRRVHVPIYTFFAELVRRSTGAGLGPARAVGIQVLRSCPSIRTYPTVHPSVCRTSASSKLPLACIG